MGAPSASSTNFDPIARVYNLSRGYPAEVAQEITRSLRAIIPEDHRRALEPGAGTGLFTQYCVGLFRLYICLDISPRMLQQLHDGFGHLPHLVAMVGDVARLPFLDGSFDTVIAAKLLRHVGEWRTALREIRRVLRPGGLFLHVEEAWLERTEASAVRPRWQQILAELGYAPHEHPGPTTNEPILEEWRSLGAQKLEVVPLASWLSPSSPAAVINHLARRGGSSTLAIPEDILAESIRQLRSWAAERWADPEAVEHKRKGLEAIVVQV